MCIYNLFSYSILFIYSFIDFISTMWHGSSINTDTITGGAKCGQAPLRPVAHMRKKSRIGLLQSAPHETFSCWERCQSLFCWCTFGWCIKNKGKICIKTKIAFRESSIHRGENLNHLLMKDKDIDFSSFYTIPLFSIFTHGFIKIYN